MVTEVNGLALTVHGPAGAVDLVVPVGASASDVAREYARQAGLAEVPDVHTRLGRRLPPGSAIVDLGVDSGDLLVAAPGAPARSGPPQAPVAPTAGPADRGPGPVATLWFGAATSVALLTGWYAAHAAGSTRQAAVLLLAFAALVGVLPVGSLAHRRVVAAPAFGAAAAFAVAWDPHPARLPTVIGVAALIAAVVAAVGRALDRRAEEAMRAWIATGTLLFVVSTAAALLGLAEQVVWAVLLVAATFAARLLPGYAVEVPDHLLLDLERLAVTAWSARERPAGRRGRTLVRPAAVAVVAARGTRMVTACSAAVLAVTVMSAPLLLDSASLPIDRIGARLLVLFCGGALLLAARSYRHVAARSLLRLAGLACLLTLVVALLPAASLRTATAVVVTSVVVAAALVLVAVATGRGWRSAWWSRRAEVAEGLAGAGTIAALVVASGLFRALWEIKFRV